MLDNQINKRYAAALFEIARNSGAIEEIYGGLGKIINFCHENMCLKEFLSQTYIDKKERLEIVDLLGKELRLGDDLMNLLHLLVENERTEYLPRIYYDFSALRDNFLNIIKAKVISAKEMKQEEKNKIKNMIEKALNKKVAISCEVDEEIIGGYIINIDNTLYDGSIKTQINNFYNYLKQGAFTYGN